jgi:hypothetical protein
MGLKIEVAKIVIVCANKIHLWNNKKKFKTTSDVHLILKPFSH